MAARCFVIMPFDPAYDDVFEYGIRRTLARRGIESFRMDQVPGSINLIEQMIRHLCEADLIVADLTGANANVLYELGVAHAAGASRQAVLIAENGSEVPFDLAPYKVVYYDRSFRGIENLSDHLLREIDAIEQGDIAANPVLDYLSRKARRPARKISESGSEAASAQLSHALVQYLVLSDLSALLAEESAPSLTDLCQRLGVASRKSVVEAVRNLENAGLVARDARGKQVFWRATETGRNLTRRLSTLAAVTPSRSPTRDRQAG
jgi:DNA-binding MarR family transcriptional regulator